MLLATCGPLPANTETAAPLTAPPYAVLVQCNRYTSCDKKLRLEPKEHGQKSVGWLAFDLESKELTS